MRRPSLSAASRVCARPRATRRRYSPSGTEPPSSAGAPVTGAVRRPRGTPPYGVALECGARRATPVPITSARVATAHRQHGEKHQVPRHRLHVVLPRSHGGGMPPRLTGRNRPGDTGAGSRPLPSVTVPRFLPGPPRLFAGSLHRTRLAERPHQPATHARVSDKSEASRRGRLGLRGEGKST